ncbi:MAG: DUF3987 domain-containing protein [Rhodospirillales bacterium]|nr:DUF3987 domain-containing protein [Rhodospirillales bacterium]
MHNGNSGLIYSNDEIPCAITPNLWHPTLGEPCAIWTYHDEVGNPVARVCRFDITNGKLRKEYRPYSRQPDGAWQWQGLLEPRPLYNLDRIVANPDAPVIVVEGEKAADALQGALPNYVVTTAMHGAQSPRKADWTPLASRNVTIWPDADEAGIGYAKMVAGCLEDAGAFQVRVVPVYVYGDIYRIADPEASDNVTYIYTAKGWDAADAISEGWDTLRIGNVVDSAQSFDTYTYTLGNVGPFDPQGHTSPANNDTPWPVPVMSVLNPEIPAPKYPVETFGAFWGRWVRETAQAVSAPVEYIAGSLLAVAGSLIGNARWVSPWTDWEEPPVLWCALVGTPSAGKSPAMSPILKMLAELGQEMMPEHDTMLRQHETVKYAAKLAREKWEKEAKDAADIGAPLPLMPEAAEQPIKPELPRLMVSDATTEAMGNLLASQPKGILFYRDELAGWLGNFDRYGGKGGDRAFWIEAFGGRSYVMERVKHDGKPVNIPNLSIPVLGGIQPDRMETLFMRGDDDGLTARFLWFWPEKVPPRRPDITPNRQAALRALRSLMALRGFENEDGSMKPRLLSLSPDASDLFQDWRVSHAEAEPGGSFAGWWGKCPGVVLRLALVLQMLWWSAETDNGQPDKVSMTAIDAAIRLMDDFFKPTARKVYGENALDEKRQKTSILARAILDRRPDTINVREIYKLWGISGLTDAASVQLAVSGLTKATWLRTALSGHNLSGGRPRQEYAVNPRLFQN